jgi:hypothetical protein
MIRVLQYDKLHRGFPKRKAQLLGLIARTMARRLATVSLRLFDQSAVFNDDSLLSLVEGSDEMGCLSRSGHPRQLTKSSRDLDLAEQ